MTALRSLVCSRKALGCTCSPSPHYEVLHPTVKRAAQSTGLVPREVALLVTGCTILRAKLTNVFLSIMRSHLPGIGALSCGSALTVAPCAKGLQGHADTVAEIPLSLRSQLHLVCKGLQGRMACCQVSGSQQGSLGSARILLLLGKEAKKGCSVTGLHGLLLGLCSAG